MTLRRLALSRRGEDLAAEYLRARKYLILRQNYRCPAGEIDLIAARGKALVFVEVKTRSDLSRGEPYEAVTPRKKRKLWQVAEYYLQTEEREAGKYKEYRFDAVSILLPGDESVKIEHLVNIIEKET